MMKKILLLMLFVCNATAQQSANKQPLTELQVKNIAQQEFRAMAQDMRLNLEKENALNSKETLLEIAALKKKVDCYERLFWLLLPGGLIGAIAGIVSLYKFTNWHFKREIKKLTESAIYGIDPTKWSIKVPTQNFENESRLLKKLGFRDLRPYMGLDSHCKSGIIIYMAKDNQALEVLHDFVLEKRVEIRDAAFVVYTSGTRNLNFSILDNMVNYVPANFMNKLSGSIYEMARTIRA